MIISPTNPTSGFPYGYIFTDFISMHPKPSAKIMSIKLHMSTITLATFYETIHGYHKYIMMGVEYAVNGYHKNRPLDVPAIIGPLATVLTFRFGG